MLYVAGEIFLWMLLAFALGVLVGWFVWGVRQRKVATTKEALAAVGGTGTASSDIESVTVRPVARAKAPPDPHEQLPVTPPAGTPIVPPLVTVPVAAAPAEPAQPAEPAADDVEPAAAPDPAPAEVPVGPSDDVAVAPVEAPAVEVPDAAPALADDPDLVAGSPALASLLSDPAPVDEPIGTDPAPTPAAGTVLGGDDLTVIEGIGPGIEGVLKESGVATWYDLAAATPDRLRTILDLAGDQYRIHDPSTWPQQAALASAGQWDDLTALQATLGGGTRR